MKKITFNFLRNNVDLREKWLAIFVLFLVLGSFSSYAQTTYYSKSTATDFNSLASWGTATDGTGTAPASISNADNFIVANTAAMTLSATATVRQLTINAGSLTVAANTLTVSKVGTFDSTFAVNSGGTLNFSGGAITVNGNVAFASGSNFTQSGGTLTIDGNNGGSATGSVASGTHLFAIGQGTAYSTGTMSLTGGKILIVDPVAVTAADYVFFINLSSNAVNITAGANHTLQIGDGVSTDAGGNATYGYRLYFWNGTGAFRAGKFVVNAPAGTNRFVTQQYKAIYGEVTVTSGELRLNSTDYTIAGNLLVDTNGILTASSPISFAEGTYTSGTAITYTPSTVAQTISGAGVFRNLTTSPTASLTSVIINNNNATGVTLLKSLSISGTLTLTLGKVVTTTANLLTVGTATAAGTISGGSATAYINGPLARTIASGSATTSYIAFPVGKAAYAPISLAPATTAVTVMKAEAFDTNGGTAAPSIMNLAANRRWEAPLVSGTITNLNVRLGDTNITATKIPVQAPTAAGAYTAAFGSVATYAAGTPNTTTSSTVVTAANYTGFLSFAESNVCSGTPAPGNTIASVNNICSGTSVTFSVQNSTVGTGVTYQWQSSVNGTTFADITGATSVTYTTVPSAALYYKLNVMCATGSTTGASTPVQITFSNPAPTTTTPAARCGQGVLTLAATGPGMLNWYAAATGGAAVATGTSFTTPVLTATTDYYVSNGTAVPSSIVTLGTSTGTIGDGGTSPYYHGWGGVKTQFVIKASELSDAGIVAGPINSIAFTIGTVGTATLNSFAINIGTTTQSVATTTHVDGLTPVYTNAAQTLTAGVNTYTFTAPFNWNGTSNIVLQVCYSNVNTGGSSSTVQYYSPGFVCTTYTYADSKTADQICPTLTGLVDGSGGTATSSNRPKIIINGTSICAGPRTLVTATVNTPPVFTLSGNPAPICAGQTSAAVTITAGAGDYNTYVWTPSTGFTGSAATGWTFNPAVSTTYTLQASQSSGTLCNALPITVNVIVNQLPSALSTPATVAACAETVVPLTATGGTTTINAIGTATTKTADTEELSVFGNRRINYKIQTIYTAAELIAAGVQPGNINSVTYFIDSMGDADNNTNYLIKIGTTTNSVFPNTTYLSDATFTTVYGPGAYTHAIGENTLTFAAPFVWNGTSNIVVQLTYDAADDINNAQTFYTDLGANTTLFGYNTPSTGTLLTKRFNTRFNNTFQNPVTWTPVTNLYTNAAATTPYVAGTNATTVYFKSSTASPAVPYTATATNSSSCTRTATVNVSVTSTVAPTVPAATQDFCNAGTVADLVATGTAVKWYAGSTGGTALTATTPLVNGTIYYASQTADGCESVTRTARTANINVVAAPAVANPTPVFCNAATVADLLPNGADIKWYAGSNGGTALVATDALVSGTPYYASQTINGCEGLLRATVTPTVNVVAAPAVANPTPVFCNAATVADLLPNGADIKWYADATNGTALLSTEVLVDGVAYYASQTIDGCEGLVRSEVTVTINVTPVPTGDDEQEFCDAATVADLTAEGDNIVWYNAETAGDVLAADEALVDGTVYYASQTIDGCEGLTRFGVTAVIHTVVADAPENVEVCTEYVLPALVSGAYFTEADGQGTEVAAGTAITETTTLFIYAQEGVDVVCFDENTFTVTVANVQAPTGDATQVINGSVAADVTVADLQADPAANGTITWYASEEDAQAGVDPLGADTVLTQGATYYATQTVGECTSVDVFAVLVDIVLGREEFDLKAFTYHPNPVQNILNISYSSEITSVTVFNLLGQRVISQQSNANDVKVDMSSLADGAYVVNITAGATVKTIKVIKKQ